MSVLAWSLDGAALTLLVAFLLLLVRKARKGEVWTFSTNFRITHILQGCVQSSIFIYMSFFSENVSRYAPLIFYQIFFAFILDFLASLYFFRNYRFGFAALPIVLSTNLFIWFPKSYFYLQLLMIAIGVLSKYLITREIDGRRVHVFNPSAIGMFVGAWIQILMPYSYRWAAPVNEAYNQSRPGIFLLILFVGLASQWAGGVVLVSLGALVTLFSTTELCRYLTGLPLLKAYIDPALLVGITLLVTDPATTPKSKPGRLIFGCVYGLGIILSYSVLCYLQKPGSFAKILTLPFLNYYAPYFDRIRWKIFASSQSALRHSSVHMAIYITVCLVLFAHLPARTTSWIGKTLEEKNGREGKIAKDLKAKALSR